MGHMDHIMGGANIVVKTKMNNGIVTNVKSLSASVLKKELLWLNSYSTDWSKEISRLIKEELNARDILAQSTGHIES